VRRDRSVRRCVTVAEQRLRSGRPPCPGRSMRPLPLPQPSHPSHPSSSSAASPAASRQPPQRKTLLRTHSRGDTGGACCPPSHQGVCLWRPDDSPRSCVADRRSGASPDAAPPCQFDTRRVRGRGASRRVNSTHNAQLSAVKQTASVVEAARGAIPTEPGQPLRRPHECLPLRLSRIASMTRQAC
jgi:hypothetical protein